MNKTQKINAAWFLILDCIAVFCDKDVKSFVSLLIALISCHIIFSDKQDKKNDI